MQKVIRVAPTARAPIGTISRRRPQTKRAHGDEFAIRGHAPKSNQDPDEDAIGKVKLRIPGSVQRNRMPSVVHRRRVADYQIHQAHQLRHEKNKRKNSQSQQRMGEEPGGRCTGR